MKIHVKTHHTALPLYSYPKIPLASSYQYYLQKSDKNYP